MRIAKSAALLGLLAMGSVLVFGFTGGNSGTEGAQLLSLSWGVVSLVDFYVGFLLFSGGIVYPERSWVRSTIWVILMIVPSFFTACLYTLIEPQTSAGDWKRFWTGRCWSNQ